MKKFFRGCFVLMAVCFFLGCGLHITVFYVIPTHNQNKWNHVKPENYSVSIDYGTFGGLYSHYRETVTNGVAHRSDSPLSLNVNAPTIDQKFDAIKQLIVFPLSLLMYSIEYDPIYGYPVRIEVADLDLGKVTEITDFIVEE